LNIVFDVIVTQKLLYASSARSGLVSLEQMGFMQKLFIKAYKWGITNDKYNVCDLFKTRHDRLFQTTGKSSHCLHRLLPPTRNIQYSLRQHGHPFELTEHKYSLTKDNLFVRMLYDNIYSLCELLVYVVTYYHLYYYYYDYFSFMN